MPADTINSLEFLEEAATNMDSCDTKTSFTEARQAFEKPKEPEKPSTMTSSNYRSSNDVESASPSAVEIECCTPKWKRWTWGGGCSSIILLVIILLATSLKKLSSTEYGVQYNVYRKTLDDAAKNGGLHIGPPGYRFIKFPSTFVTVDLPEDTCVSRDGLRVKFDVTFQYSMPEAWLTPAVIKFRNFERWAKVVEAAGNSAIHHTCSEFQVSSFQHKRELIQKTMEDNLRLKLEGAEGKGSDGVYARAVSLQLRTVILPKEYKDAIANKQAATEEIALAKNQRVQSITQANTELLAAGEEARIINNTAINEADIILTEARIQAEKIRFSAQTEASVISSVKERLGLTSDGVLAYLSNRLYESAPDLRVSAAEPADLSREGSL